MVTLLYGGKFLRDKIFADFAVDLTSVKIKSANQAFSLFYHMTVASICGNFICRPVKISHYTVSLFLGIRAPNSSIDVDPAESAGTQPRLINLLID